VPRVLRMTSFSQDFPLAVTRIPHHGATDLHTHDFMELVVVLGGRGIHYSDDEAYEVAAGDAFVVSRAHGYKDTENLDLVNILFHPDRLALPLAEARKLPGYHAFFALEPKYRKRHGFRSCLRLNLEELASVSRLIAALETELDRRKAGFEFMATSLLMQLIGMLSRAYERMQARESGPLIRLGNVMSYIERHFTEPIRMEDLTRIAGTSHSGLLRSFRGLTGHPPKDYIVRLRLARACALLQAGEANVTEAAYRAGFSDSNYFTRQFHHVMGCAPREYLRRARAEGVPPKPGPSRRPPAEDGRKGG
jgi:AraC family L-rhamnose operon transcriptional activator RhaR